MNKNCPPAQHDILSKKSNLNLAEQQVNAYFRITASNDCS
jgi:hypothetical protein